jgi:hypothetical protein
MPPENDEGTFYCEHHKIPIGSQSDLLDATSANDAVLMLFKHDESITLLQFKGEGQKGYTFTKLGNSIKSKHSFLLARILPDTYFFTQESGEASANVYFIYERCQNIGVFEFTNKGDTLGTIEHAKKFTEFIKTTSNKNLLNQSEDTLQSQVFSDEEIEAALKQGHFE